MTDTLFEQLGGTYTQTGDYLLPDLSLPAEKETGNIGVWALRHKRYMKQHHKVLYYNLLTSGKLDSYLADIEEQAQQLFLQLVKELAEKEFVTEKLKAENAMLWVRQMVATDATRSLPVPNSRTFLMTGAVRSVARQRKVSVASRKKISIQARTPFGASFL